MLKNSKRTPNYQRILFYSTQKAQTLDRIGAAGGRFEKKTERGIFQHRFCRKNQTKKLKGDSLEKIFAERKNRTLPKKLKRDPLVSPGIVCYAEKKKNFFGSVPWANGCNLKFWRTFSRTVFVISGVLKKKDSKKSHSVETTSEL